MHADEVLAALGLTPEPKAVWIGNTSSNGEGAPLSVRSPIDGSLLAELRQASPEQVDAAALAARAAFERLREVPAPMRGEFVRRFANVLRAKKRELGALVTLEVGKTLQESEGEVQEMIDICDFAVGLGRQLYGLTIASERPAHRLMEQWHPLGPVGVISAFNFPVAVWAWNAALAWVCGDPVVWKPSEKAPLSALACHRLALSALEGMDAIPTGIAALVIGGADAGHALASSREIPLLSATGSVAMGRKVSEVVARRLGRTLLELGGNNAAIVTPSADLDLTVKGVAFAALGTAGQRCTTLRRLFVHTDVAERLLARLRAAYASAVIGDPRNPSTLIGPLIDRRAADAMRRALERAREEGGNVEGGGLVTDGVPSGGVYVRPALVRMPAPVPSMQEETFAPILYVVEYSRFEEAIAWNNAVPQGLSSAIFSNDLREVERFCSASGSDCGLLNVNLGTSGAEIGGAFGGEKDTGGGRESGSDAWKSYMRRATTTLNFGGSLPLAQGIRFDLP